MEVLRPQSQHSAFSSGSQSQEHGLRQCWCWVVVGHQMWPSPLKRVSSGAQWSRKSSRGPTLGLFHCLQGEGWGLPWQFLSAHLPFHKPQKLSGVAERACHIEWLVLSEPMEGRAPPAFCDEDPKEGRWLVRVSGGSKGSRPGPVGAFPLAPRGSQSPLERLPSSPAPARPTITEPPEGLKKSEKASQRQCI